MTIQEVMQKGYRNLERSRPLPAHVRQAAQAILKCRTAELGGHMQVCPEGHFSRAWYNSCKHRICPQCAYIELQQWLARQKERLLACDHYHVIPTIPSELHPLWLVDPRQMTTLLFAAAHASLFEMLKDEKHLGARPGAIAALHTWGQTLVLHPHLHFLVTGGGLDKAGQWRQIDNGYLVPAKALMMLFRGKLIASIRKALEKGQLACPPGMREQQMQNLLNKLGRKKWNVRICERYSHGEGVLTYLSRYLRGGPINNRRLISCVDGKVTFSYKDYRKSKEEGKKVKDKMTLPAEQFLQRFFLHVPQPNTQVVRSYGLYANSKGGDLNKCREKLGQPPVEKQPDLNWKDICEKRGDHHPECCPTCGCRLVMGREIPKKRLRPEVSPLKTAA